MSKKSQSPPVGFWVIGLVTLAVFGVIVFLVFRGQISTVSSKTNRELALTCTTNMATQFHIHSYLEIVINGQKQEIPKNIGVKPNCMNSLHTHDSTGEIHVEAPEKRDFTLADFFAIWNKTFTKDQILNYKADDFHIIRETVNGTEAQDYENTILRDREKIIIYYEEKK